MSSRPDWTRVRFCLKRGAGMRKRKMKRRKKNRKDKKEEEKEEGERGCRQE